MSTSDAASAERLKERVQQEWTDPHMAAAWRTWRPQFAALTQPLTAALVQAAQVETGMQVLDLASGAGEPAFTLAQAVGPHGHVTATDLSVGMVATIAEVAQQLAVANLTCLQADAEALPFPDHSFDVVTCRLGVMFFPHIGQALREVRRVLRPGGRVALLVWGPQAEQAIFTTTMEVVMAHVHLPSEPDAPNPYRFAEPGSLAAALRDAGFARVDEVSHRVELPWPGSPVQFWQYRRETSTYRDIFERLSPEQMAHVSAAIHAAVLPYYDGHRVNLPALVHVATGVR